MLRLDVSIRSINNVSALKGGCGMGNVYNSSVEHERALRYAWKAEHARRAHAGIELSASVHSAEIIRCSFVCLFVCVIRER